MVSDSIVMGTYDAPRLVKDWEDCCVRSHREIENGLAVLPAGTIFRITASQYTKFLAARPCPHCGVTVKISIKVPRRQFEEEFDFVRVSETF